MFGRPFLVNNEFSIHRELKSNTLRLNLFSTERLKKNLRKNVQYFVPPPKKKKISGAVDGLKGITKNLIGSFQKV